MHSICRKILLTLLLMVISGQALALRCGGRIIEIDDRNHRVRYLCGDPSYIDEFDQAVGVYPYQIQHVEVWTYNFGKSRFMQELIFENGVLRRINTLGYGY